MNELRIAILFASHEEFLPSNPRAALLPRGSNERPLALHFESSSQAVRQRATLRTERITTEFPDHPGSRNKEEIATAVTKEEN